MKIVPLLLLFCSGFGGLGFQMVWSKTFAYGLGHEFPAVLAVLSAFMGGMALGSFLLKRPPTTLRCYGFLELIIGVWAMFSVLFLPAANTFALKMIGLEPSPLLHWGVAFLLPFIVLLPATAAMGATLPAMTMNNRSIGLLYGANTAGAMAGTLLATFVIVPALGFRRATLLFGTLNILCALLAFLLPAPKNRAETPASRPLGYPFSLTLLTTGLLGMGLEAVGVRILTQVFENTIFTFASILAIYLFGLFTGAFIYHRFCQRVDLADLLGGLSVSCLLSIFALSLSPLIYARCHDSEMITAAAVFLLPTLFMGALFSHLIQRTSRIGAGIALNTLGAAFAPILFPIILVPAIGSKWTLVIVSFGYLAFLPKLSGWRLAWIAIPGLLFLALPSNLHIVDIPRGDRITTFREGIMSSVAVLEDPGGNRSLRVDNHFQMGGTAAAEAEYRHAHIPLLLHPNPRKALFLGLGTGISFAAAALHPNLQADGVELLPEVVGVMNSFEPYNNLALRSPNLKFHVADARRFIKVSSTQYDVIIADLFHPARDGAGSLYTLEHFQAIRHQLTPGGLFCQWLPLHQLDRPVLGIIVKTFAAVFPDTQIYLLRYTATAPVIGLVGFMTPPHFSSDWIEKRIADPDLQAALKKIALSDSVRFFGNLFGADAMVQELGEGVELNTEEHPVVTFKAPAMAYRKQKSSYATLAELLGDPLPDTREMFEGSSAFKRKLAEYMRARNAYLVGLIQEEQGDLERATALFIESAAISPDFTTGYARCVSLAGALAKTEPEKARELLNRLIAARPSQRIAREMLDRLEAAKN